ncbi:MAG: cobalamin-dependent protein [Pseudomonadota bacterium]
MTDSHDSAKFGRGDGPGGRVADLASRAIAELAARRQTQRPALSEQLMEQFLAASRNPDEDHLKTAVSDILRNGIPRDEVVDLYIPEAARRLGDAWVDDSLGFAEVTIGGARLQRLVRELTPRAREQSSAFGAQGSMLVVVREGEFHTLGAMLAASQLRRSGVSVRLMLCEPDWAVIEAIKEGRYLATLFSVGAAEKVAQFRDFVAQSKDAARGRMLVGLGGAMGHMGDEAKGLTGADFVSSDAREALRQCGLKILSNGAEQRATSV